MKDEIPNDEAAEKARAEAEARRQRILDKSNERLGIVSGEAAAKAEEDAEAARAAKMQALRRRRFKQAAASREAREEEAKENAEAEKAEPAPVKTEEPAEEEKDTLKPESSSAAETATPPQKKYKGVAKMRRQKIKEKQKEEPSQTAVSAPEPILQMLDKRPNRFPVILHLLTTLLLFLAGLDVGWYQHVHGDVTVHRELAPRLHGPGVLNRKAAYPKDDVTLLLDEDQAEWSGATHEDEFSSTDKTSDDEYEPNIDPIFGVDFDELAKGDDILHILARGAVFVHRLLLRLFYFLPIKIIGALLRIPKKLVATPPVLCLVSIALRQGTKLLLGAGIPVTNDTNKSKDVLDMVKNSAMSFVTNSFPTSVALFEAFNHVRSDMYVILCGVFVGLALTHHSATFKVMEEADVLGEIPTEEILTTGDEL